MKIVILLIPACILLAACGVPSPEEVGTSCLSHIADKNYEKALAYCGPRVRQVYSNNTYLVDFHRRATKETEFTIEPADYLDPSNAALATRVSFTSRDGGTYDLTIEMTARLRDKWYIDDVWHTDGRGNRVRNALDTLPTALY